MSQFEFMSRLRRCLAGLPEEEIDRAVEYYEDYFADAGMSDEEVIAKLGSPEKIAENIRKEILGKQENTAEGSFTERGFETEKERENFQEMDRFTQLVKSPNPHENESNSDQEKSGTYDYSGNQEQDRYYYDDRKERKKNRRFIATLLIIFGIIWLCIVIFITAIYLLFSTRKEHRHDEMHEMSSEMEETVEENIALFDDEEEISYVEDEKSVDSVSGKAQIKPEQNITGLKIDVGQGKVVIEQGEEFSAQIKKSGNNRKIKSTVKNGIWELKEKNDGFDLSDLIKNVKKGGIHLVVTVPEGFEAEKIEIEVDAGQVEAGSLTAKKVDFEVSAGTIDIENLVVTEEAEMEIDMGTIDISSGNIKNLDLQCDMGKAVYSGMLTGKNKIGCDMGSVEIELEDAAENYTFSINNDMGKVSLDGKKYNGLSSRVEKGNGENKIGLEVDMGTIKVKTGKG